MEPIQGLRNAFASKFKNSFKNYIFSKEEFDQLVRGMTRLINIKMEEVKKAAFDEALAKFDPDFKDNENES
jgi:hypothetical protein